MTYGRTYDLWVDYEHQLRSLIDTFGLKKICEVGGGANPYLSIDFVSSRALEYTVMDISQEELDKAPLHFRKQCQDILDVNQATSAQYDLMFTKMLAEHVRSGETLHRNIFRLLNPGGLAVHFFPTLYALPFVVNRIAPDKLAEFLLTVVNPRDGYRYGKLPAYYDWCRGPTRRMLRRLTNIGYEIIEYRGLYGHTWRLETSSSYDGYYKTIPLLARLHVLASEYLLRHPIAHLTSFAFLVVKKPGTASQLPQSRASS